MDQIVSAAICLDCGTLLLSFHVHYYVTCDCPNSAMLDGGSCYSRYGAMDLTKVLPVGYNLDTGYLTSEKPNYASALKSRWPY
jgi:hypothetical protein